jgi:hypothetical protein
MGTGVIAVATSWSALKRKDLRHHRRYAVDAGVLQVTWLDLTGKMKMTRTRALNISEGGMCIELPEGAAPMSLVRFESSRFKVMGSAAVRHCRKAGSRYIVGLEFVEGLNWRAPKGDVTEPIPLCDPGEDSTISRRL